MSERFVPVRSLTGRTEWNDDEPTIPCPEVQDEHSEVPFPLQSFKGVKVGIDIQFTGL